MSLSTSTPQTSADTILSSPNSSTSQNATANRSNQPLTIQTASSSQHSTAQRKQQQEAKGQRSKSQTAESQRAKIPSDALQSDALQRTNHKDFSFKSSTSLSIPLLLEWWQQRKRLANSRSNLYATLPKGEDHYLKAYYRLMEIYSVVKSGGVKTQTEAVKAFSERESNLLTERLAALETDQTMAQSDKNSARAHIQQELNELHHASSWRLKALKSITSEEETAVKTYLPDIENTLTMQVHCA